MVYRIYVEKRPEYAVEARGILSEIRHLLRIKSVTGLRLLNRYDVEGISEELFSQCCGTVFSEPQLDFTYTAVPEGADAVFATEFLPGQPIALALRSEQVDFAPEGSGIPAVVKEKSFAGGMLRIALELPDGSRLVASRHGIDQSLAPGQTLCVRWAPEAAVPVEVDD